jgi:band 7 protein
MGLFDAFRGQFIEVIEAADFASDVLVYRFPVEDSAIKMGAQLTVREGQCAIFLNEGVIADIFGPGLYTLSTENMPVMTKLKSWKYGFKSPFKADVYFVSTRLMTSQKWGTQKPVLMRDAEFGMIRLSAFGIFSYRVARPEIFMREVFGSLPSFTTRDIIDHLRRLLVSGLADTIGETKIAAIDMVNSYDEIGAAAKAKLQPKFEELGLTLQSLTVESISLPEAVEKAIDKRTSMGVLGNIGTYAQYQAAEAIGDAGRNGGIAGSFAGMGVGMGAGVQIGQTFAGAVAANTAQAEKPAQTIQCASCGAQVAADVKFCPECGKSPRPVCPSCGAGVTAGAKFCPECGKPLAAVCSKCGEAVTGKFCPNCGTPRE